MASASIGEASAAAVSVVASSDAFSHNARRGPHAKVVSFRIRSKLKLPLLSSKVSGFNFGTGRSCAPVARSQSRKAVDGPSNDSIPIQQKSKAPDGAEPSVGDATVTPASKEAVSEFMAQVKSLVKLVDSRDIIELQLKQPECELIIRKKEALPQPPVPGPVVMMQQHPQPPVIQPQFVPPPPAMPAPASAGASPTPPATPAPTTKPAKSSLPPLKSPMAGTFYRSSGPGQPPFVKVGDKVNKGQVLCIIEAMKLMNEIEADQAGTIVEILVEDTKPVGIDQPIFVIEP